MKDSLTAEAEEIVLDSKAWWNQTSVSFCRICLVIIIRLLLDIRDKLDVIDSRSKTCP